MGKLLFYCPAWLYVPAVPSEQLSLVSLPLALSRLLVSLLAHETPLDARMIASVLSTMSSYLIHIFAMPQSRHSWATALHKRWQNMGVLWWRNLVFWSSAAGFVFLVVVVVVVVSFVFPFLFLRSCGTIACRDRPRNKIIDRWDSITLLDSEEMSSEKVLFFPFFFFFGLAVFFFFFWGLLFLFFCLGFWVFVPSWFETGFIVFSGNWFWRYKVSK